MQIRNQNVSPNAQIGRERLVIPLLVAISQTGVVASKFTPGHKFQLVSVRTYCLTKAGAVSATLKVGGRTAASLTITAATEVAGTLSATIANIRGSATEAITLEYTTDGTGALTNGMVFLEYRPYPMSGDIGTTRR